MARVDLNLQPPDFKTSALTTQPPWLVLYHAYTLISIFLFLYLNVVCVGGAIPANTCMWSRSWYTVSFATEFQTCKCPFRCQEELRQLWNVDAFCYQILFVFSFPYLGRHNIHKGDTILCYRNAQEKMHHQLNSASVLSLGQSIPVQVFHVKACATSTLSQGQHIFWPKALLARYSNLLLQIRYGNSGLLCGWFTANSQLFYFRYNPPTPTELKSSISSIPPDEKEDGLLNYGLQVI